MEVIPLSQLQTDTPGLLTKCCDSGQSVVVELPRHQFVAIQPLDADDQDDTLVSPSNRWSLTFRDTRAINTSCWTRSDTFQELPSNLRPLRAEGLAE